ncbi:MAG: Zn-dependent protease [Bacteroidetes bacterium]|nr:Zn-dependent protease [Bacteroidota bacterium]
MKQRSQFILIIILLLNNSCHTKQQIQRERHVALNIQPFEDFPEDLTKKLVIQINTVYPFINVRDPIKLPQSAFYRPRNRYRADSLIRFLRDITPDSIITLGITTKDISTTDGEIKDWGVMGLGYRPGKSCIVSTFRLKQKNISEQLFKVCIHELGHTAGLDHCPEKTCFMRDAEGGNPTDDEKEFCPKCRNTLITKGWLLK